MEAEGILQDNLDSSRVMVMVMVMMMMVMIVVMLLLMMVGTTDDDDVDDVLTGEPGKLSDLPGHP